MNRQQKTFQSLPPAVLVRTLAEARRATAAAQRHECPVLLLTEPGAQARLGPGYLLEMVHQAGAARALLDCGGDAGTAMLALRLGWRDLHLGGAADTVARVAAMAEAAGCCFHANLPAAFDLSACGPVDEPLVEWLALHGSN
jgi:hypothetical protein